MTVPVGGFGRGWDGRLVIAGELLPQPVDTSAMSAAATAYTRRERAGTWRMAVFLPTLPAGVGAHTMPGARLAGKLHE